MDRYAPPYPGRTSRDWARAGFDNVYVATGHAMLGVTLAPVTGSAIAELVTGAIPSLDLEPFDPARFQVSGAGFRVPGIL